MATRIVYLIHFSEAYKHARHYLGSASDLDERIERHRSGNGARLLKVITDAGISWSVVRTWKGSRLIERQIKRRKEAPALCPICAGAAAMKRCTKPGGKKVFSPTTKEGDQ